ncbi:MAG: hypothetical protein OXL98_08600, partial [Acidimicrobiaceae bacterium]|nr:hypothetical protein [Acidimicrobiaceae bacterium]
MLTAEQKYDLWLRMLTGQISQADAAAEAGVDRSVIARLRAVARDGAIAALQASKPGQAALRVSGRSEGVEQRPVGSAGVEQGSDSVVGEVSTRTW